MKNETNTQHTPAPWNTVDAWSRPESTNPEMMFFRTRIECIAPYTESEESDRPNEVIEKQTLCTVYGRTLEEMKANALIVSSAPSLLKENEQLKVMNENLRDRIKKEIGNTAIEYNKRLKVEALNVELVEALKSVISTDFKTTAEEIIDRQNAVAAIDKAEAKNLGGS